MNISKYHEEQSLLTDTAAMWAKNKMKERMQADLVQIIFASEQILAKTPCDKYLDVALAVILETLTLTYVL